MSENTVSVITATDVYYDGTICTVGAHNGGAVAGVTAINTATMQDGNILTNWLITDWVFTLGAYPKLIWEP